MTAPTARDRNGFLDLVRGVAIVRVTIWHTFGYAWLSYLVASMPAMFFVAGTLMARSLDHQSGRQVLVGRFRRLLIPLWPFAVVALAVMFGYERWRDDPLGAVEARDIWRWAFPIWDPEGSRWGLSFWAALWYLRCLVWLLLAAPILAWAFRLTRGGILVVPLVALGVLEWLERRGDTAPWQYQDLALYGFFFLLGFAYHYGWAARLGPAARLALAALSAAAAAAWFLLTDVPGQVVNASYPAHLFVGLAWLFASLAVESTLAAIATRPRVAAVLYFVNERALTIYLWHNAGLFCMYQLLWTQERPDWVRTTAALPIVLGVTALGVVAFGWVEDRAAKRSPRLWPIRPAVRGAAPPANPARSRGAVRRLAAVALGAAGLVLVAFTALTVRDQTTTVADSALTAPPSGVGLRLRTAKIAVLNTPPPAPAVPVSDRPVTGAELQGVLDAWRTESGLSGVIVGVATRDGVHWEGASGRDIAGAPLLPSRLYPVASVTKTFTVALILQLVQDGAVGLDDTVDRYVPDFPGASTFTVRQLIQHTSALISTDGLDPNTALRVAAEAGLQSEPGSMFVYSTPGYFLLGLIIEQATSSSYTAVLRARLLEPLGLASTYIDEEVEPLGRSTHPYRGPIEFEEFEGFVWTSGGLHREIVPELSYAGTLWSSAGVWSTAENLARWAVALWGSERVVTPATLDAMTTFLGPEFEYTGLGTYPYCPCWRDGDRIRGERWGHLGATGQLEFDPALGVGIAVYTNETVLDEAVIVAYEDLSARLRGVLRGRVFTP
ncbi:MAG: serine hydrolase [Dehalococcoidia bacterium]